MTPSNHYPVQCYRCGGDFDALAARWCNCGREVRSFVPFGEQRFHFLF